MAVLCGASLYLFCALHPLRARVNAADGRAQPSDPANDEEEEHGEEGGVEHSGGKGGSDRRRDRSGGESNRGRIAGIVDHANNQERKLCEVDDGVYFAFAGISADGRALTSKIRVECQSYRYSMGESPSIEYVARYVGGLQHRFTRTGGTRPFGVSCLIAGFDERGTPRIFRSEPSGAFAEWKASAVGKGADKALGRLESVTDLESLDWRETAEAAVRATLAGGNGRGRSCDVLLLRHQGLGKVDRKNEAAPSTRVAHDPESFNAKNPRGVQDDSPREAGNEVGEGNDDPLLMGKEREAGVFVSRLVGRMAGTNGAISWGRATEDEDEEPSLFMTGIRGND